MRMMPKMINSTCATPINRNIADGAKRSISTEAAKGLAMAPTAYRNIWAADNSTRSWLCAKSWAWAVETE